MKIYADCTAKSECTGTSSLRFLFTICCLVQMQSVVQNAALRQDSQHETIPGRTKSAQCSQRDHALLTCVDVVLVGDILVGLCLSSSGHQSGLCFRLGRLAPISRIAARGPSKPVLEATSTPPSSRTLLRCHHNCQEDVHPYTHDSACVRVPHCDVVHRSPGHVVRDRGSSQVSSYRTSISKLDSARTASLSSCTYAVFD